MSLQTCNNCRQHYYSNEPHCPHCTPQARTLNPPAAAVVVLLGLNAMACDRMVGEPEYGVPAFDTSDTAEEPASEPSEPANEPSEPAGEPEYGVPMTFERDIPSSIE